jgi:hypothetical protein
MSNCRSLDPVEEYIQVDLKETSGEQAPFAYYRGRRVRIVQKTIVTKSRLFAMLCLSKELENETRWKKCNIKRTESNLLTKLLMLRACKENPAS